MASCCTVLHEVAENFPKEIPAPLAASYYWLFIDLVDPLPLSMCILCTTSFTKWQEYKLS